MQLFRKIFSLLSVRERRQVYILLGAILFSALINVMSIASILPFMAVVTNPQVIETNTYLNFVFNYLGFTSSNQFLIFLGIFVAILLVFSNSLRLGAIWYNVRFSEYCNANLSRKMLQYYLMQPYQYFLNRNTSAMGKNVLSEVSRVINNLLKPLLNFIAQGLIVILIFALLVTVDPIVAMVILGVLGGSYALIFLSVRGWIGRLGKRRALANQGRYKSATEALNGIKDLKVLGREKSFLDKFDVYAREQAFTQSRNALIGAVPKHALETIAFGGVLIMVIYTLASAGNTDRVIPLLSLYAFAGYRLMPALQNIFSDWSQVRFNLAALDMLLEDMREKSANLHTPLYKKMNPLPITRTLELKDISYSYPYSSERVLSELNLNIKANTTVGFVGSTGSGKSTTIDVILCLLEPQKGAVLVDGQRLSGESILRWQRNIGYVPQFIYLSDDTVSHNIAFGVSRSEVDQDAVERAARTARLHDFIVELPQGYDTLVGERGMRLSGGQRQRIGIARALYHDPQVLILDEATSALDNATEEQVMLDIQKMSRRKTILMIAHRLTTVRECDQIFFLEKGRLVGTGTYEELLSSNGQFQLMAGKVSVSAGVDN